MTVARLRTEYGVDADYEPLNFTAARWVDCGDVERLEAFKKANHHNLALDGDGNLTFLASSEWYLKFVADDWPDITFRKTREHQQN